MIYNEINKLDKTYNKLFLYATYNLLKDKDLKDSGLTEDPFLKKKVIINRSKDFLYLWVLYFKELTPILLNNNNSKKERNDLIHLIFGQNVKSVLSFWYHWPTLETIAINAAKRDLEKHIKHIKEKGNYEIV